MGSTYQHSSSGKDSRAVIRTHTVCSHQSSDIITGCVASGNPHPPLVRDTERWRGSSTFMKTLLASRASLKGLDSGITREARPPLETAGRCERKAQDWGYRYGLGVRVLQSMNVHLQGLNTVIPRVRMGTGKGEGLRERRDVKLVYNQS